MTYQEFLDELRRTPRDWRITFNGRIRRHEECPITSLRNDHSAFWVVVSANIGLSANLSRDIALAADNRLGWRDFRRRRIRRDLLKACGL